MLTIENLNVRYGNIAALNDVSLHINAGEFVAIVGPNGAGKSTLFNAISGIVEPVSGSIRFGGQSLLDTPAAQRAHLGIAHVPEGRQVFASLSVRENLQMGAYTQSGRTKWTENIERIQSWFPILAERAGQPAGTLSGGEQQMLAIGRGLASSPTILMLDEPSMGLAPAIADEIFERIVAIHKDAGLTIILVEQRVAEALHFANRGYVLEAGRVILEGTHETLRDNQRIREAYLGM